MIGYKGFSKGLTCFGFQYEIGKTYETSGKIELYKHGFHFCEDIADCFADYGQPDARFAKVEALGKVIRAGAGARCVCVTDKIRIIKEIPRNEALRMANSGDGNTGVRNIGEFNSGNFNEGDFNTGSHNKGSFNTGNLNTGNRNTGALNAGYANSGTGNFGNHNAGNYNPGSMNSGVGNTGVGNSGNWNSGICNSGNHNSGNINSGSWNSGSRNSGSRNLGNRNTGDWNLSSNNTGCFMSVEPKIMMFNRPSDWTFEDWQKSRACSIMSHCPTDYDEVKWVTAEEMTDADKAACPEYKTTGGYLKTVHHIAHRQAWWDGLPPADRQAVKTLPNFDVDVFFEITGIKV